MTRIPVTMDETFCGDSAHKTITGGDEMTDHKWETGINHAPELEIGWRYRWGSKSMGYRQTVVKNILI